MDIWTELNLCIGAFFNGVFLLALALSICLQSLERFVHVEVVNSPKLVLIIGCIGLGLNIISAIVVHGKRLSVGATHGMLKCSVIQTIMDMGIAMGLLLMSWS